MPTADVRTRDAVPLQPAPPAGGPVAVASLTAIPARADPVSTSLPAVRRAGAVAPETGDARRASGSRVRLSRRLLSFIAVVVAPTALAGFYLFGMASDQYVAEFRFTLNSAEAARFDPTPLLSGIITPARPAALESQILVQ
jgi:hypothetical protein